MLQYDDHIGRAIGENIDAICQNVLTEQEKTCPDMVIKLGPHGSKMYVNGMKFHLRYLSECIAISSPTLYLENVTWLYNYLAQFEINKEDVEHAFKALSHETQKYLAAADGQVVSSYIEKGIDRLSSCPIEVASFFGGSYSSDLIATRYLEALLRCDKDTALDIITEWIKDGADVSEAYVDVFQKTQYEIGRLWSLGRISVGQEHYCTAASQSILSRFYPQLMAGRKQVRPRNLAIVACVEHELHEFGARMVADLLEQDGWDVLYLGANTPQASIVQITQEKKSIMLLLSASMVDHVHEVAKIIEAIDHATRPKGLMILVGGNAFNIDRGLWKIVGADGSALDAKMTVELARQIAENIEKQDRVSLKEG